MEARSRSWWTPILVLIVPSVLASACTVAPLNPPTSAPVTTAPAATPDAEVPSEAPTIPTGSVDRDKRATIEVSPVNYDGLTTVSASFTQKAAGRPAALQRKDKNGWLEVASGELDEQGAIEFLLIQAEGAQYRAVAGEFSFKGKTLDPVATATEDADDTWRKGLSSDFNGGSLEAPWQYSITGSYRAGGRQCSAPYPSNVAFKDGKVVLSVTKETNQAHIRRAKAAGCKVGKYFRNALLTTGSAYTMRTGMVAARIKFPQGQGMHGAVFVLSPTLASEIDVIEGYGYGKGLTSVAHLNGKRYPAEESATFVNTEAVKDREWWKQYHVYSVEWDRTEAVFRIDGVVTSRLRQKNFVDNYSVFISLLSSDWELHRMEKPRKWAENVGKTTLPQYMHVDWVKAWTRRG